MCCTSLDPHRSTVNKFFFTSLDEVQESLCCHPFIGVGISVSVGVFVAVGIGVCTYKLIDYNSYTHIVTLLIFDTYMPCDKTFPCMSKL